MAVKVLLVEDVAELRGTIRIALALHDGFEVVGEAATGADASAAASAEPPDIVVLDLGLPDIAGQDVLRRLKQVAPDARVVVSRALDAHNHHATRHSGAAHRT